MNKKKIFNDPIYGFINIYSDLIYDIIETPYFQRLRRIKQTGLADLVYPGANHTRFHHALGAMHLMGRALDNLRDKGHLISNKEYEAALIAILLHDIGHSPFSHTLEYTLLSKVSHEEISLLVMQQLNNQFKGKLSLAIDIFTNKYERPFFHQLVSSQLDIDRLDYLKRDSFFTGVSEGSIGSERIIKLFEIVNDNIVVEEKGIYSVENFLSARRLMYWQVYLHKTGIAADAMLKNILIRAKHLLTNGINLPVVAPLKSFLSNNVTLNQIKSDVNVLNQFVQLDDYDIWAAIKSWTSSKDKILSDLATSLINRKLYKIKLSNKPLDQLKIKLEKSLIANGVAKEDLSFYITEGSISNEAYMAHNQKIRLLKKDGSVVDIEKTADLPNIKAMSKIVTKYYLCWSKELTLLNI
ncbi:dNTP triphosphohydrolase, broad substrate specificity [hydrothermal vent metagenome]|uniref:DNTP triphosphohydrolase, broad substrate specificity n=1 Tax=hydrothermal vent metagenome TaxID=652676 RepID=A0A3B0U6R2_9ZZZZ